MIKSPLCMLTWKETKILVRKIINKQLTDTSFEY